MFLYSRDAAAFAKDSKVEQLTMEIVRTNNVIDIAKALAERIINEKSAPNRIVVTPEEMELIQSIFRIKGYDADGNPMKKGRPAANSQA